MNSIMVCICTYKRPQLLRLLLNDLEGQTLEMESIIIVDGDPASGDVLVALQDKNISSRVIYVPSNHSNLSYQRYLGWGIAKNKRSDFLIYLDDDIRMPQKNSIEKLLLPFSDSQVVGVTGQIRFGSFDEKSAAQFPMLLDRENRGSQTSRLINWFGSSRKILPGGLTPVGERVAVNCEGEMAPVRVEWLRGGVMAFRMEAILKDCFIENLFAIYECRCGKGEDTILSRRVMRRGKLIFAPDVLFEHPNSDLPKTYPITSYKLGYSTAYSRRLLNDHYRIDKNPTVADRVALIRSYAWNNFYNFLQAMVHLRRYRLAYAAGYWVGSLRGLFQPPTAKALTPQIDWWKDAEAALQQAEEVH